MRARIGTRGEELQTSYLFHEIEPTIEPIEIKQSACSDSETPINLK